MFNFIETGRPFVLLKQDGQPLVWGEFSLDEILAVLVRRALLR
jgi:hypothetical protein